MSDSKFVHLHCHSHYSLLDGAGTVDRLIERAKQHGMNALALTDHGNLHGALEFYKKCKDAGINPIVGYEAYIAPGSRFEKDAGSSKEASFHLTLLAKNRVGFRNLVKLASHASLEGFYFKPRIDKELLQAHHEGLICLSGCVSGEFSRALLKGHGAEQELEEAVGIAQWFHRLFGDRYFIEIMNNGVDIQRLCLEGSLRVAERLSLPVVATCDTHYVDPEDADTQDVLLCINTGRFRTDTNRMKMDGRQYYLRSPDEMYACFPDRPDVVARSQEIADTVDIDLELGKRHFPVYKIGPEQTAEGYLRELCIEGLKERYADKPHRLVDGELSEEVMKRLNRELSCIEKLGFPNYFLIVWDFVRQARKLGVPATARGSGVGALVCYALYLSHVCPLEFDLLFERFLDENRREAPDIDIDFCKERRGEIIRYVKDKYGEENVAQIGTFGTLQARAAIKDVGRVLNMPLTRVSQLTEMIPDELGIELAEALTKSEDLKKAYDGDPEVREVLDFAMKLEGLARNVGTHAAAVVIADKPLTEYVPLCRVSGKTDIITQWSMGDVEAAGLLKMDFLGLRNLTILSKAVEIIQQTTGETIDPLKFPLDDKPTFALLCRGETKGIFQLESGGIRDLLQKMKPDHFRDIIATNALYRPGPLEGGMVEDYVAIKHGRKQAEYKHPVLKEVLEETNGIMIYQEQVMRILNRLGGIELAAAYTCIKAISKKKESLIAKNREQFLKGSVERGMKESEASDIWELIIKFAGYGFNKCVVGDTEIIDALTGERTTVKTLFDRWEAAWSLGCDAPPFHVHALDPDGKLQVRRVRDVLANGSKPVFRVRTAQGRTLLATDNHPLLTLSGWRNLGELEPGDMIAAARSLPVTSEETWPAEKLIVLAGLLSEGNTCHPTCLYFYNNHRGFVDDFVAAVERFPETVARVTSRRGRFEVCVSTGRDARFRRAGDVEARGDSKAKPAVAETMPATRSGAFRWAESLGILGRRAAEKSIPADIFRLSDACQAIFLGRLWSGDGFVGSPGQMPYYATSSHQLARDVSNLLLRLGILNGIHEKTMRYRYRGESRTAVGYTVHLFDDSLQAFCSKIAPHMIGRETQLSEYIEHRSRQPRGRDFKDLVPADVRHLVDDERRRIGLPWRQLESDSGVSMREFYCSTNAKKRGFRRQTIERLAEYFDSPKLRQLARSDVFWDRIVSIEPAGTEETFDLTVEENHNFVANGLIVHNSHSTAYALIAYQTAYLKAHYPVAFMAALLTGDIPGRNFKHKDALVEHLEDCQRMQIEVLPPDVNASFVEFAVEGGKIRFGLSAIKGCGGSAGDAIVASRKQDGTFKSLFEFCERVDPTQCGRASIESLIKAGAFDGLKGRRAQFAAVVEKALQAGASALADRRAGQKSLFGDFDEVEEKKTVSPLPDVPEWPDKERLAAEKEVLGFYLTAHPLAEYEKALQTFCSHTTADLAGLPQRAEVILGGMLSSIKLAHTKNPRPGMPSKYANFDLEDTAGAIRCIAWPEQYAQFGELIQPDAVLVVRGSIDRRGGDEANLIVNELIPLNEMHQRYTNGILVKLESARLQDDGLRRLHEVCRGFPGNCELQLLLCLPDGGRAFLKAQRMKVDISPDFRTRLDDLLGPGQYKLLAAPPKPKPPSQNGSFPRRNGAPTRA